MQDADGLEGVEVTNYSLHKIKVGGKTPLELMPNALYYRQDEAFALSLISTTAAWWRFPISGKKSTTPGLPSGDMGGGFRSPDEVAVRRDGTGQRVAENRGS